MKVMNKIEILKGKVEQLNKDLKTKQLNYKELKDNKISDLYDVYFKYFSHVLEMGDTIKVSEENVTFTRSRDEDSYPTDLITLYFRNEDWRNDTFTKIETSFYSTNANDDFELNRMITIGKVGQTILDKRDDLLEELNSVVSSHSVKIREVNKEWINIDGKIRDFKKEIRTLEEQFVLDQAEVNGIKFKMEDKSPNTLPNFDVKSDRTIYNVKELKIIKYTTSGKSADVALKVINNIWNPEVREYKEVVENRIVERVRMRNIKSFLQYNSQRISVS